MREILFRGKRVDNGEWVNGWLVKWRPDEYYIINPVVCRESVIYDEFEVIPETIGQYTDMFDKNNKKIFEGDIIKTKYDRLCEVIWFSSLSHAGWDLKIVNTIDNIKHTYAPSTYDLYDPCNLEIVGNIHDNPELLGVINHDN